jgi:HD-GYP domain-containing protein (c-di-GMP phosphodiesterase class II)
MSTRPDPASPRGPAGDHRDALDSLNLNVSLREKLASTHRAVQAHLPFVARIAVALYDPKTALLKSYLHSSGDGDPLPHYEAQLGDAPSLGRILEEKRPRVINHLLTFERPPHEHTERLGRHGYAASYTLPMYYNGVFFGFVFFNSHEADVFGENVLQQLDVFGHMISLLVINEIASMHTLLAAVTTAAHMTHSRDPETGSHLDRMSRYARLIARHLATRHNLDDEYIEHVFMFAPLHDIGKIGIPDSVLLKQGRLSSDEIEVMKSHARKGREIIDDLLANFGLESVEHVDILRNIAEYHHECVNGRGYPSGLAGKQIPLEARIVAVADVFDALTSRRPYKEAWSNDQAFAMLETMAGESLDPECVRALFDCRRDVEHIQAQFAENPLG